MSTEVIIAIVSADLTVKCLCGCGITTDMNGVDITLVPIFVDGDSNPFMSKDFTDGDSAYDRVGELRHYEVSTDCFPADVLCARSPVRAQVRGVVKNQDGKDYVFALPCITPTEHEISASGALFTQWITRPDRLGHHFAMRARS